MHLTPMIINGSKCKCTHKHSTPGFTQEAILFLLLLTIPAAHFLNICPMKQNIVRDLEAIWVYIFQRKLEKYLTEFCKFLL